MPHMEQEVKTDAVMACKKYLHVHTYLLKAGDNFLSLLASVRRIMNLLSQPRLFSCLKESGDVNVKVVI